MTDFCLPRSTHIRSGIDFERIYSLRQRAGDDHLLMFVASNELKLTRFGLSVSKKHGNAVIRNRIKRLLREAFRLIQHELPSGLDLILIPRFGSKAELKDYQRSIKKLSKRLAKRFSKNNFPSQDD